MLVEYNDTTEPLPNGAKLPDHPAQTTSKRIVKFGQVSDDADGTPLTGGLHRNEITMLKGNQRDSLSHLYRYQIENGHIFHTRPLIVIECATEDVIE